MLRLLHCGTVINTVQVEFTVQSLILTSSVVRQSLGQTLTEQRRAPAELGLHKEPRHGLRGKLRYEHA